MKYRRYDDMFKVEAVELALQPDIQIQDVAAQLGIHPFMLSRWKKEYREGRLMAKPSKGSGAEAAELRRQIRQLERDNRKLNEENEILKEARRFF
ncbi:transposase [Arhodomonas sp. KWT2]|uniref:transposase n=1 Tax=unclassified Arhodomonas TaxID=2621637 RepID=UPI0013D68723|nr:transposase [Arhodomonas sp. KWT]